MKLGDIWGATDKPEPKPAFQQESFDLTNHVACMVAIHRKIVDMQAKYNDEDTEIDLDALRQTTGMNPGAWKAVLELNTAYYENRPMNRRRMVAVAKKLEAMTIDEWVLVWASKKKTLFSFEEAHEYEPE